MVMPTVRCCVPREKRLESMGSPQERSRAQSRQLGYNAPKPRRWGKGAIDRKGAAFGRCGRTVRFKSGIPRAGARDNLQPGFTQRVAFQGDPPSAWASVLSVSSCEDDGLLSRAELSKQDAGEDAAFWGSRPLLTPYLSAPFLERLQVLYRTFLRDGDKVLDLCCDMDSHLPAELTVNSLVGTGLNRAALAANARLTASFTQDLNRRPKLTQLTNREFDAVLCCAGYEYLQKPLQVLQEVRRVLRPGGLVIISFPAKCVVQKAISAWISRSQPERALLVARYLKAAGFERLQAALQDPPPQAQDMVLCNVQGQPGRDPCTIIQSPRPAQVISDFTAVLARRPDLRARPPPGGEEDPTAAPVKLPNSDVILRNFPGCAPPTPDVKPANSGSAAATQKAEQIGASGGAASLTWLPVYNLMVVEARSLGIPASAIPQLPPGAGANEIRAAGTHLSAMMASFTSSGL